MTGFTPSTPFDWLSGLERFGIKLGLDNMTALLEARGRPDRRYRTIHVAGTNGKGSVTAIVDRALRAAGHRAARYTSPHLIDITERFVINGRPVDRGTLAETIADIRTSVEALQRSGRLQVEPTFFEVVTAAAFDLFRRAEVDTAVCEVGLGGRLDATNVIEPVASAITTIGFDHQQHLGSTLREIAFEKAGIIKPGVPVVVGRMAAEAFDQIEAIARERGADVIEAWKGVDAEEVVLAAPGAGRRSSDREGGTRLNLRTPSCDYGVVEIALAGAHQIDNAIVAVRLLETLDSLGLSVPRAAIVDGLANVRWPGRLESRRLPGGREALLDAAHNLDGAVALARFLVSTRESPRPLIFAAMRDKDAAGMIRVLAPEVAALLFTRTSNTRSEDPLDLACIARTIAPELSTSVHASPGEALEAGWRLSPRVVVAGSIFLLGDVMKVIDGS